MDIFYIVVISIAAVLLILILTYIGILMKQTKGANTAYPPVQATCPDYWDYITDTSSCVIPSSTEKNVGSIYGNVNANRPLILNSTNTFGLKTSGTNAVIKFTDSGWISKGKSAVCGQRDWANTYGIVWDGVSNYNGC